MAVYMDWPNRIIHVPKDDLVLIQLHPLEIREMNLNWFRMQLKGLEDDPVGMQFPDTHMHNTEVTLGSLTFARVIAIINGYTVTFEDGQYAVNLVGANSNVGDMVNVNQVSVRSSNSAGMTSSPDIEYSSFAGGVNLDMTSEWSGTVFPVGTPRQPVNNLADAMLIATYRGFNKIYVIGDAVIDSGGDYSNMVFIGSSHEKTTLVISDESNVNRCEFYDAKVEGTLDGDALLINCMIEDLAYVNGEIKECVLKPPGVITLGGTDHAMLVRCVTECTAGGDPVTIDMGGAGQPLAIRDMSGAILLRNKTGLEESSAVMAGGTVFLDLATITAGRIKIAGVCDVVEWNTKEPLESGMYGGFQLVNNAISRVGVADAVWNDASGEQLLNEVLFLSQSLKNKREVKKIGATWTLLIYAEDGTTPILSKPLRDFTGAQIANLTSGTMAIEEASGV